MPQKNVISSFSAPAAVGPYSQGIETGGFVFLSGQIPLDPATGAMVEEDIKAQTRQVIENIKSVLAAAGLSLSNIVKTTVFLTDMAQFGEMNHAYEEYFSEKPPARSCVEVAALPRGAMVEIESIATKL